MPSEVSDRDRRQVVMALCSKREELEKLALRYEAQLEEARRNINGVSVAINLFEEEGMIMERSTVNSIGTVDPRIEARFTSVFEGNLWGSSASISGPGSIRGSDIVNLAVQALSFVVANFEIFSISDIPCGDFNWMCEFLAADNGKLRYTGFDIVKPLIDRNQLAYSDYNFAQLDITTTIPPYADLVFSKELFLHLLYKDIFSAIRNIKSSGSRYILTSSHFGAENTELPYDVGGSFRELDVCAEPISFPAPIWRNALFGLWEISSLPDFLNDNHD